MDVPATGIAGLRAAIDHNSLSAQEVIHLSLERAEQAGSAFNCLVELRAQALEENLPSGPLSGVPVLVKDFFVDGDRAPTAGSNVGGHWMTGTAEVLRRLRAAGAAVVGYANLHEWGLSTTSAVTATGPILNPWDRRHLPGGSSGGSAAALAAGVVPAALGTDAGGSIRCPAACCGVVGFKPTWGTVPVDGYVCGECSVDHVGPMARSVGDVRTLWEVIAEPPSATAQRPLSELRIGIPRTQFFGDLGAGVDDGLQDALGVLGEMTAGLRDIEMPGIEAAGSVVALTLLPHTARLLRSKMEEGLDRFQPETATLLMMGRDMSEQDIAGSAELARDLRRRWDEAFEEVDVIVTPTLPALPATVEDRTVELASGTSSADLAYLGSCAPMNVAGVPALSMPVGEATPPWTVSITLSAQRGRDRLVLDLGEALESALGGRFAHRVAPSAS